MNLTEAKPTETALTRALQIASENRSLTPSEEHQRRRDLEAAGPVERAALAGIYVEVDRASNHRSANARADAMAKAMEQAAQHTRARPQRRAALSAAQRAAFLIGDRYGTEARMLFEFVRLSESDTTNREPAESFEPG